MSAKPKKPSTMPKPSQFRFTPQEIAMMDEIADDAATRDVTRPTRTAVLRAALRDYYAKRLAKAPAEKS